MAFDYTFTPYVGSPPTYSIQSLVLMLWCTAGPEAPAADQFITLTSPVVAFGPYNTPTTWTIDEAMAVILQLGGMGGSCLTSPIGSVLPDLKCPPPVDPVTAAGNLAAQASCLVEWGYFGAQSRAKPMYVPGSPASPGPDLATVRALPNCYLIDAEQAGIVWNVEAHPESGQPTAVRLMYSCLDDAVLPDGSVMTVLAPADPGWTPGTPFSGATAPVLVVDYSSNSMDAATAANTAQTLASLLGQGGTSGTLTTPSIALPVESGGVMPAPYWHGADWVETQQGSTGPLYITRWHVDVDSGACDGDVGMAADVLLNQLVAAGVVDPIFVRRIRGNESVMPRARGGTR